MNYPYLAGLALACALTATNAQAEMDDLRQQRQMERLDMELHLSDQQKQELRKIFDEARPQFEALRKQGQALREQIDTRMKAVLTAEQKEKYDKLRQQRMEQRHRGRQWHEH